MISFLILLILIAAVAIGLRYRRQLMDQKLLDNPPPRGVIEVSLPRGVSDSSERMQRFYRSVASAATGDDDARKQGMRQVDIVEYVRVTRPGVAPQLSFLIYADPDRIDMVKRAIKTVYDAASIVERKEDPMALIEAELRPPPKEEPADQPQPEPEEEA